MSKTTQNSFENGIQLNGYENALINAVQRYDVSRCPKNANLLMEKAVKVLEQTALVEIKEAADFFKDGEFNKGDRYSLANKFIYEMQRLVAKSMQWLDEVMEYYNIPIRPI